MEPFSKKYGYKTVKSALQTEAIDNDLRNTLWNACCIKFWNYFVDGMIENAPRDYQNLVVSIWLNYFKLPIDTIPDTAFEIKKYIRNYFVSCPWYEVYDFIQYLANYEFHDLIVSRKSENFIELCNSIMEQEVGGYRFIAKAITPITDKHEVAEIEKALKSSGDNDPVVIHLKTALNLLSDRKSPDHRNSIKESISAVEAICNKITGKKNPTLADALKTIGAKIEIHGALKDSFIKLYGYTSDAEGIRHALIEAPTLDAEDAKFMLISCSAFINYLKVKSSKAGIKI
jgi:hypothetical protein